jgi:MFS family permease
MVPPPTDRSYRALFAVPDLPRVLAGMVVARVAGGMLSIAIILFTLTEYGSPVLAGIVTFASIFPGLVLSPIAGALLDRHGRARLVILDYCVAAGSLGLIGVLALAGDLPAPLLVLIAAAASLTQPLSLAGLRSLLPILAPTHLWERANAIDSNGYVVATLLGPPIAGGLVALLGGPLALIVNGGVFAAAAIVLIGMPDPRSATESTGRLLVDAWQGLRYTLRHPTLRALALSISAANMCSGALYIVVPILILDQLRLGPFAVGAAWAVMGVTGLVGALLFGRIDSRGREKSLLVWAQLGIAVAAASLLLPASLLGIVAALGAIGFVEGPSDVGLFTIRQRRTDPAWMGRAFAVSMAFNFLGFPIGSAIAGWTVELSVTGTILLAVLATVAAAILMIVLIPRDAEPIGETARSGDRAQVESTAPMQPTNGNEHTEGGEDEHGPGGDRAAEIAGRELAVDDER